jgi:hypothetical protein
MGILSQKAIDKVGGPAWEKMREKFFTVSDQLLSVAPESRGELTTIYVKFSITGEPSSPVYAVVWVKSSKALTVGLALPEGHQGDELGPPPQGMRYKGLTKYLTITPADEVPGRLRELADAAYRHVVSQSERPTA